MARQRSPNWCVTIFDVIDESAFKALVDPHCSCYSAQVEKAPTTGKLHIQAFLQFSEKVGIRAVQKIFNSKPHCEVARSVLESFNYCQKMDTRFGWSVAKGKPRLERARTDIHTAAEIAINQGIRAVHAQMPDTAIRFHNGLVKHVSMMDVGKRYFPVTVKVFWGKAGTGKSRSVPDGAGRIRVDPNKMVWYDDCVDRENAWLDDFYGNCQLSEFLQMTDVYSFPMRVMGGFYPRKYTTLYITSNVHPSKWFPDAPDDVVEAIKRRLEITQFSGPQSRSVLPETADHFQTPLEKPSSAPQIEEFDELEDALCRSADHFSDTRRMTNLSVAGIFVNLPDAPLSSPSPRPSRPSCLPSRA